MVNKSSELPGSEHSQESLDALKFWVKLSALGGIPPKFLGNLFTHVRDEDRNIFAELATGSPDGAKLLKVAGEVLLDLEDDKE